MRTKKETLAVRGRTALLIPLLLFPAIRAAGEAPELVTDRPDQTESSSVLPRGLVQVEAGWTHSESEEGGQDLAADGFPETLVRLGLGAALELRVGLDGYRRTERPPTAGGTTDVNGVGDGSLGFKLRLAEARGARPRTAVLVTAGLPTGESGLSSERVDPSFRFAFAHEPGERLSLGFNAGVAWSTEEDASGERDTLSVLEWTATLGHAATEKLGLFVELFGAAALSSEASGEFLDAGLTYLLRDNLQLDASAGVDLSDSGNWFGGVGISFRLPR